MFTDDELRWLALHGFAPEDVYDGRGESKEARRSGAKEAGKELVLGPRCRAKSHRLRTRAGHCVQCNTANLGFQRRYNSPGYVYIAGSSSGRVIKLGTAIDTMQRENQLRKERYAGFADWEVLFFIKVSEAGRIEYEASQKIRAKRAYNRYFKDNVSQTAVEVMHCSFSDALRAIAETVGPIEDYETWRWTRACEYEFSGGD